MDIFDKYYVFESKEDQFCFAGHRSDKSADYEIINTYIGKEGHFAATLKAEEYNLKNGFIDVVAYLEKIEGKYKFRRAINKNKELTKDEFSKAIDDPNIRCFAAIWEVSQL